jgi:hypothetical protein
MLARTVRLHHPLLATAIGLLGGGLLATIGTPSKSAPSDVPTLAASAIKPGMKGYGLTVFSGTEPEKFDVEVIGVLHKFRPNQDLVLIKTIHPRLAQVKVVAGMSGSPIFLNDGGTAKLIGAYAYGWAFGNEPVAGVTPIETMVKELDRPLSPALLPAAGKAPLPATGKKSAAAPSAHDDRSATAWTGTPGTWSLEAHAASVGARLRGGAAPNLGSPQPVDTPLVVGGLSDRSVRALASVLAPLGLVPLQAGGAGSSAPAAGAPAHYVDGGAVAIQMMRGDAAAQATGTVTKVYGKRLLGFGHPMMEVGRSQMPAAIAKILWVLSSDQRSFKIGEPVRPLGTMIQDRESAIVVDEEIAPPMIPVSVELFGDPTAPKKKWAMEIVNDKFLTPMWSAFAFGDAIGVTLNDRTDASWKLASTIRVKGHGTIAVEDFGVSGAGIPGGAAFFQSRAGRAIAELMNNPWEPVTIERIDTRFEVEWKRDAVLLRGAELLDLAVEPGASARVKLTLKPYFGAEFSRVVSVKIDPVLAGREVELEVLPGWLVTQDAAAPENLGQLIRNLQLPTLPPRTFVVQYRHPEGGIAWQGKVAQKLPGFAVDALKPTTSTSQPESIASYVRASVDVGGYPDGTTRLRVTVKPAVQ